jgi:hypothetical protein
MFRHSRMARVLHTVRANRTCPHDNSLIYWYFLDIMRIPIYINPTTDAPPLILTNRSVRKPG